jgi:hypothetical protein
MENNEETDGVALNLETVGWPEGLVGVVIKEQIVYNDGDRVTIVGDPIWSLEDLNGVE